MPGCPCAVYEYHNSCDILLTARDLSSLTTKYSSCWPVMWDISDQITVTENEYYKYHKRK